MQKANRTLAPLFFGLATLTPLAWKAQATAFEHARWIAPPANRATNAACPLFRKEFVLDRKPRNVTLRIVGLGDYNLRVNGRCLTATLLDYKVPMIHDLPDEFHAVLIETTDPFGPFGGKSVSEISCNGAAPAIAAAIHDATGVWIHELPATPERVLCVTALGDSIKIAQSRAYAVVDGIRFDGMQYRRDIGFRAVSRRSTVRPR